jgi:hypothetical protein
MNRVELAPHPCVADGSNEGPPCSGLPIGSQVPSFFVATGGSEGYLTDLDSVREATEALLNSHSSWALFSVSRSQPVDPISDGYVIAWRFASGNSGRFWYATASGGLAGFGGNAGRLNFSETPVPGVEYLCNPRYGPFECE